MDFMMNLTHLRSTKSILILMFCEPLRKINTNDNPELGIKMKSD